MHRIAFAAAFLVSLAAPALAANPTNDTTSLGSAGKWSAYAYAEKGGKVCYLRGTPVASEPAALKRGRVDLYVTQRPAEKSADVVQFDLGYAAKPGSDADLDVDGKAFSLFTDKDSAWNRDAAGDKAVTAALAKGRRATIKAVSARGAETTDTYSLDGFTAALDDVDKACGVKE